MQNNQDNQDSLEFYLEHERIRIRNHVKRLFLEYQKNQSTLEDMKQSVSSNPVEEEDNDESVLIVPETSKKGPETQRNETKEPEEHEFLEVENVEEGELETVVEVDKDSLQDEKDSNIDEEDDLYSELEDTNDFGNESGDDSKKAKL
jgi:hypothetical protein